MPVTHRWTPQEETILQKYYTDEGRTVAQRLPGRTAESCAAHARRMGLHTYHRNGQHWSRKERDLLTAIYKTGRVRDIAQHFPNHTVGSIYKQAERMGLQKMPRD